jgi:putative membrane protein
MINYNTKEWFSLIFKFHKSDTFRVLLPSMIILGLFCALVAYVELEIYHLKYKSTTVIHSLLGFVISLLLVFRTNTAYDRWWEGRRQWGSLLNAARNLSMKLNAFLPDESPYREKAGLLITNYGVALKAHLRGMKAGEVAPGHVHQPNHIAAELYVLINNIYKEGLISGEQLLALSSEVQAFTDICGACERIRNTPIPYAYSLFVKKFIFVYIITMPFSFVTDFSYYIIPIVVFVFYVLASLELIAEEIEDPFGRDTNDLPTDQIAENMKISTREILYRKS